MSASTYRETLSPEARVVLPSGLTSCVDAVRSLRSALMMPVKSGRVTVPDEVLRILSLATMASLSPQGRRCREARLYVKLP
ncbi:hypothetical protein D3C73_1264900 [compost metagenome]